MQTRILDARLSGDPWPEIPRTIAQRVCRRCGEAGHDRRFCARPPLPPKEPREPKTPVGGATQRGTPEYTAKLADAMRASWVRRRAARAATIACTENEVSVQAAPPPPPLPPAVVRAKLPPRCARCFRVGHVDAECPKAARAAGGQLVANISPSVSDHSDAADSASMTRPDAASFEVEKQEQGDDDGTDLTDLVDVPDAEPTVFPDVNLGVECHACGQRGHIMSSPGCPLTTKPGAAAEIKQRPGTPEEWAIWREERLPRSPMPSAFTESPLTMRRHLTVIDPEAEVIDEQRQRPRTRGECEGQQRPCPWAGCRYHLALDVLPTGNLHRTFGEMDFAEMPETCALDVADRNGATLDEIGQDLNVSRERIRQIETLALASATRNAKRLHVTEDSL